MRSLITAATFAALSASLGTNAKANEADIKDCVTNNGLPGIVFAGHYGTIQMPNEFESVAISEQTSLIFPDRTVANDDLTLFADINYGAIGVVYAEPSRTSTALISFLDGNAETIEVCRVQILQQVSENVSWQDLTVGNCDLPGTPEGPLVSGELYTSETSESVWETGAAPQAILDVTPKSRNQIEIVARNSGRASFIWLGDDTGSGKLRGFCPITVKGE